ncbi:MBL fold metallo-hydrolase [candidate division KSB1 bacterium]|nr:MBL fold metallo-hydrolase [candidate division KSB1 bacterium]
MFLYDNKGIKIEGIEFWLDARRKVPFSFISHGHSDHLKNHVKILATPATLHFHALRGKQTDVLELDFGSELFLEDLKIQLFPAGHILGSAMIRIERDGVSLLYSGDFKLESGLTAEAIQVPQADILIMESTYGDPDYTVQQTREDLVGEIIGFIEDCYVYNETPVILAYALGKAQEAMKIIGDRGYRVHVHSSAWRMAEIYRRFGTAFQNCRLWHGGPLQPQEVLIIPPHLAGSRAMFNLFRYRTVFLSGWTKGLPTNRWRADHVIPLSDHADFNGLVQFARMVNPQKIYTTHGFDQFPHHLCALGFNAEKLSMEEE